MEDKKKKEREREGHNSPSTQKFFSENCEVSSAITGGLHTFLASLPLLRRGYENRSVLDAGRNLRSLTSKGLKIYLF